jgi:hypothetical protein
MKKLISVVAGIACCGVMAFADHHMEKNENPTYNLPKLEMKNTKLSFDEIAGYEDYKIVASHFRKDKNEIRYILANDVAYEALKAEKKTMPQGSKVVKIGWSVQDMATFPAALEAKNIERVEYMIKDKDKHKESDGWGYARFVKKDGKYSAWGGDPKSCVACHAAVKNQDALFTRYQKVF